MWGGGCRCSGGAEQCLKMGELITAAVPRQLRLLLAPYRCIRCLIPPAALLSSVLCLIIADPLCSSCPLLLLGVRAPAPSPPPRWWLRGLLPGGGDGLGCTERLSVSDWWLGAARVVLQPLIVLGTERMPLSLLSSLFPCFAAFKQGAKRFGARNEVSCDKALSSSLLLTFLLCNGG